MAKKLDGEWRKLLVYNNWGTTFYLVHPEQEVKIEWNTRNRYSQMDTSKYYDVRIPDGREFVGCSIKVKTSGEMTEYSSPSSEAFFMAEGLTIKLESGYLMRVNKAVTAEQQQLSRDKQRRMVLSELTAERDKLNAKIAKLSGSEKKGGL